MPSTTSKLTFGTSKIAIVENAKQTHFLKKTKNNKITSELPYII